MLAQFTLVPRPGENYQTTYNGLHNRLASEHKGSFDYLDLPDEWSDKPKGSIVVNTLLTYYSVLYQCPKDRDKIRELGDWLLDNYGDKFQVMYGADDLYFAPYNKQDLL